MDQVNAELEKLCGVFDAIVKMKKDHQSKQSALSQENDALQEVRLLSSV